jgi:site-specific DNA-methyltransferase (adenine-specific)
VSLHRGTQSWEKARTCEWGTPADFYRALDEEFHFTTDACASPGKGMHDRVHSFGGLQVAWRGVVWCNPPYGRELPRWIAKAAGHAERGEATVVMLVPSRTDTSWWHEVVMPRAEIRFVRGRLRFVAGSGQVQPAPFPSAVLVFRVQA